jgi:cytochrome c peroxidase
MRQRNVLVMATLPLLGLSLMVGSVGASGGGAAQGGAPAPLSTLAVPLPSNLDAYVVNRTAAIQLGKALFWDQQAGSNGTQACATCHFHAGADNRTQNQINPGPSGTFSTGGATPNYALSPADFPFYHLLDPQNQNSSVVRDNTNIAGSQGVFKNDFPAPPMLLPNDPTAYACTHGADATYNVGGVNVRQVTGRNTPSAIDAVFNFRNFWDGRANNTFNGVDPFGSGTAGAAVWQLVDGQLTQVPVSMTNASAASQAVGPPNNGVEMACNGSQWANIGHKLLGLVPLGKQQVAADDSVLGSLANTGGMGLTTSYAELIQQAFAPALWSATDPVAVAGGQYSQMEANFSLFWGLAIDLYESTLVAGQTPVDAFAAGNTSALTAQQQEGLAIFNGQGRCAACHSGSAFTDATAGGSNGFQGFHNTGVTRTADDLGAGPRANDPKLDGAFKTSGLRNVELTGPYMHNGSMATLRQVVDFYNRGGNFANANLDSQITPLGLTNTQEEALVAFMQGLTDPRVVLQQAPFDHPSICVANGAQGNQSSVTAKADGQPIREALDNLQCMGAVGQSGVDLATMGLSYQQYLDSQRFLGLDPQLADTSTVAPTPQTPAPATPTALPTATATPQPIATSAVPTTYAATPLAMTPTATAYLGAGPQPTATKTARPDSHREKLTVSVRVRGGIIRHGESVMVSVRTRPGADTRITLRLTGKSTRCSGAARQRVCARVTVVLAQRVVHGRANRQGLLTRSVALGYSSASALRATLGVQVWTRYGAVTHTAVVGLLPTPHAR